jgi:XTP/dITP diphosphohydrolase
MKELLIATRNKGKVREIRDLLKDLDLKITSLDDYPDLPKIEEDGKTFADNALKKAATISQYAKCLVMGEDSGLEVRALNNRPGIYSSRYSGENATDKKNNARLLKDLRGVALKKRQARYRCFVALTDGKGIVAVVNGSCAGLIALRSAGANGFGYDPLFYLPRFQKTFGALDPAIKSRISHRARAMRKLRTVLINYLHNSQTPA